MKGKSLLEQWDEALYAQSESDKLVRQLERAERERDSLKRQLAEANATCAAMREAVELLREIQSAGVSFEDERVAYVEIQVHKETLKAIDAFLMKRGGENV